MLQPLPDSEWDKFAAAHLLKRAGFGLAPGDWKTWEGLSLKQAVDKLVDWEQTPDTTPAPDWSQTVVQESMDFRQLRDLPEEERRKKFNQMQFQQRQHLADLQVWWLQRMIYGPRPLQEKMALFWHGHFATSFEKVKSATMMWKQNELFRSMGNGNYQKLLVAVGRDPAMLLWLDGAQSEAEAPNENYGRELMELFTLGEGHYTEDDIKAIAKAYTGWRLNRRTEEVRYQPAQHAPKAGRLFGKKVETDEEVVEVILDQKQASLYLMQRLWRFFAETEPDPNVVAQLAQTLQSSQFELRPVLKELFSSRVFYAPDVRQNQIKSPVQWLVGTLKISGTDKVPPLVALPLLRQLGQELFLPPNVKGWDGGRTWISTSTLFTRQNAAKLFVYGGNLNAVMDGAPNLARMMQGKDGKGEPMEMGEDMPADGMARREFMRKVMGRAQNYPPLMKPDALVSSEWQGDASALTEQLAVEVYQAVLSPALLKALSSQLGQNDGSPSDKVIRDLLYQMMIRPEYQLT